MAHISSIKNNGNKDVVRETGSDAGVLLNPEQQRALLHIARKSIAHGLENRRVMKVVIENYEAALQKDAASFVTLHRNGQLRGCIGALEAYQPLVADVAEHAFAAAFSDPRFPAVTSAEFDELEIDVSVLSQPEPMFFESQADLLSQLRPGVDGLILEEGGKRGTFLPSVWESLPEPKLFLQNLKLKAGLYYPDYWSDSIRVSRYTTQSFSDKA